MTALLSALFEILSYTAVIVLVVLGLGIIVSMMGVFNFAQGEFLLLGAYTTYLFHHAGMPVWLGMVAAPFVAGAAGVVMERLVVRRLYTRPMVALLATYAVGLMVRETVRALIGGEYLAVPEPVPGVIEVGTLRLSAWRLCVLLITIAIVFGSYLILARTSLGLRVRASLENPALARGCGVSTGTVYALTFGFGCALAGIAGALLVPTFSLFADLGLTFLIQGFVAVMVGGIGGFAGPIAGAGVIGLLSAALPWVMSSVGAEVLVFVLALLFVKFRPQGLLSTKGV